MNIDPMTIMGAIIIGLAIWGVVYVFWNARRTIESHQAWVEQQPEYQRTVVAPVAPKQLALPKPRLATARKIAQAPTPEPDNEIFEDFQEEEQKQEAESLDISLGSEEITVEDIALDDLEEADPAAYYKAIADIRWIVTEHYCRLLSRKDGIVKIIRDDSSTGYPGLVAKAGDSDKGKLDYKQWAHCCKKDTGIFWDAGVLITDDEGNVILDPDEKDNLEAWFEDKGYSIKRVHMD